MFQWNIFLIPGFRLWHLELDTQVNSKVRRSGNHTRTSKSEKVGQRTTHTLQREYVGQITAHILYRIDGREYTEDGYRNMLHTIHNNCAG